MRALELDYIRRRPAWPAWLLLAVGLLLAGDALFSFFDLRDEVDRTLQRQSGPRPVAAVAEPLSEPQQREMEQARQILQELALPWEPLFGVIEAAVDANTALLALEPDAGKGVIRISGEARDYAAVLGFMRRLEAPPVLAGVHLLSHEIRVDVAERPYLFTLSARWRVAP